MGTDTGSPSLVPTAFKAPAGVMFSCPCARVKAFHARPIWKTSLKSCSSVSKQEAPLRPYQPINPGLTSLFPVMGSWALAESTHKHEHTHLHAYTHLHGHLPAQCHTTKSLKTHFGLQYDHSTLQLHRIYPKGWFSNRRGKVNYYI